MMIEMLVRFTQISMPKIDKEQMELKKLLSGDEEHITPEFKHDFAPKTFDLTKVESFNPANTEDCTTLRFYDKDESVVVKCPYKEFQSIFTDMTGKLITSFLPKDYITGYEEDEENEEDY